MVVVVHQDPGVNTPTRHVTGLTKRVKEEAPVIVIMKDGLPPVSPSHDMIKSAC
jgi:hypothetical protein